MDGRASVTRPGPWCAARSGAVSPGGVIDVMSDDGQYLFMVDLDASQRPKDASPPRCGGMASGRFPDSPLQSPVGFMAGGGLASEGYEAGDSQIMYASDTTMCRSVGSFDNSCRTNQPREGGQQRARGDANVSRPTEADRRQGPIPYPPPASTRTAPSSGAAAAEMGSTLCREWRAEAYCVGCCSMSPSASSWN